MMRADCKTDIGPVRSSNQDSCDCGLFSPDSAWGIVCDGMGGANGGNVASSVAVEKLKKYITANYQEDFSPEKIKDMMLDAVCQANEEVYGLSIEKKELRGMGTTVVLLIAAKGMVHVAHVGDSRAYVRQPEGFRQLTVDHSYVQDLVRFGQITQQEARVHPQRNIITRALGVHPKVECDYSQTDFSPGDTVLACSDGLSNYMEDEKIEEYIDKFRSDGGRLSKKLLQYAIDNGSSDNITTVVINND